MCSSDLDPEDIAAAFEIEGYVEKIGDVGTHWIIAGIQGLVSDETELIGNVILGSYAEVCGHREPTGEIHFDKIQVWDSEERQLRIEGLVEEINVEDRFGYWIVAGHHVEIDERTFIDESRARAQVGMWADVTALPSDPYPYALRIRLNRPE